MDSEFKEIIEFFSDNIGTIIWGVIALLVIIGKSSRKKANQQEDQQGFQPTNKEYSPHKSVENNEYDTGQKNVKTKKSFSDVVAAFEEAFEDHVDTVVPISENQQIIEEQNRIMQQLKESEKRKARKKEEGQSTMRPRSKDEIKTTNVSNMKNRTMLVFSDDSVVNGVIWSEILTPKGKGFRR